MVSFRPVSMEKNELQMLMFIVSAQIWLVVSVFYSGNMGIFASAELYETGLQNTFITVYCIGLVISALFSRYYNFGVITLWGTVGAMLTMVTIFCLGGTYAAGHVVVSILALFSSMFSLGVIYAFLNMLTYKSMVLTMVFMIASTAMASLVIVPGGRLLPERYFEGVAILLLIPVTVFSFYMMKSVKDYSFRESTVTVPLNVMLGGFALTGFVQFLVTLIMNIVQFRVVTEQSSFSYFYTGQIISTMFVFVAVIIFTVRILDLYYVFIATSMLGFVAVLLSVVLEMNFINAGIFILGFCEIGTVVVWLVAAAIYRKYQRFRILFGFFVVFGIAVTGGSHLGMFFAAQDPFILYFGAGITAVIAVALSFIFIPLLSKMTDELYQPQTSASKPEEKADPGKLVYDPALMNLLTSREREVASLLLQGHTAPQIATVLNIKLYTAKVHIRNIYGKLEVSSRPELFIRYGGKTENI